MKNESVNSSALKKKIVKRIETEIVTRGIGVFDIPLQGFNFGNVRLNGLLYIFLRFCPLYPRHRTYKQ